jgi:hypothetical protein
MMDYAAAVPQPPLRPADVAWIAERVRQWLAARQEQQAM